MTVRYIDYKRVIDVVPAPRNPKRHAEEHIAASVERFGYTEPIMLDERTGKLVAGHGRLEHLLTMQGGDGPPPEGITVDEEGEWLVPVVRGWSSADDAEAEAYLVASNRLTEIGGWDGSGLADVLTELVETGDGLLGTGYDEGELEALLTSLAQETGVADDPFSGFPDPNLPDVVSFSFGDYSGKVSRKTYEAFVIAFEQQRAAGDDVLLDDVLARWLGVDLTAPIEPGPESDTGSDSRVLARLFSHHQGKLALGAFSGVRRTDVEGWQRQRRLYVRNGAEGPVAAIAARRGHAAVADFRGEVVARVSPGEWYVSNMAGLGEEIVGLVEALPGRRWVEAWQENPIDREVVDKLGLTLHGVKIKSTSELIGVYGEGDVDPLPPYEHEPFTPLGVGYDAGALEAEVRGLDLAWTSHYSYYNVGDSWQALALRSYGGTTEFIIKPSEMTSKWKRENPEALTWQLADSPLFDQMPVARAICDQLGALHRVRLMRLMPGGGELVRHSDISDPEAGAADGQVMRLHFPVWTNPGVKFTGWALDGSTRALHMATGEAWYLDTRKPHTARNDGDTERVHLVVDVEASPAVRALLT